MSRIRLYQVDAFTTERFAGNPAGVVLDAQLLSDAQMQSLARELGNGDTAFVLPPDDEHHDLRIRFFTPRKEAAFVGHATLAAHAVLQRLESRPFRLQQGQTGTVEVVALGNDRGFAIRQPPPASGRVLTNDELQTVLTLLGISAAQLDPTCPAQIMGSASTRLMLGVADSGVLDALQPQHGALGKLSATVGALGYFLFTRHPSVAGCDTEARMFCPAIGIDEDPVSGNAHAMLGAYLYQHGLLAASGATSFTGIQGRHVGRPGRVAVELELETGAVKSTRIIGHAVIVFQSVLDL